MRRDAYRNTTTHIYHLMTCVIPLGNSIVGTDGLVWSTNLCDQAALEELSGIPFILAGHFKNIQKR